MSIFTSPIQATYDSHTIGDSYAETAARYPHDLPENALTFLSVGHVKAAVAASGSHYFDRAAIRFFNARSGGTIYGQRFWVESKRFESDPRTYSVAWVSEYVKPNGERHLAVERLGEFATGRHAASVARRLGRLVGQAVTV